MNQDQIIDKLLQLKDDVEDFTVTFSGKSSKKVDGLYHPDLREIIIHNENFKNDNEMIYTAIHEFAHHIQFTASPLPISCNAHSNDFWNIFHNLLVKAENKGIYINMFEKNPDFIELTRRIREKFIHVDGQLMKDFGKLLVEAFQLCKENHASYEDYVDRALQLNRATAKNMMKVFTMDINPEIGFENMKTVASIKDDETRTMAEEAFIRGDSPDMVKAQFTARVKPDGLLENLILEKEKIERSLDKLTVRLVQIEQKITEVEG